MTTDLGAVRTIWLRQLPVAVWAATKQHTDELLREFTLLVDDNGAHSGHDQLPSRLVTLIDELRQQFGGSDDREAHLFDAVAAGIDELDVELGLPPAAAVAARALNDLLDEADAYCRQGKHLLTLATPAPLVRFRCWYLEEVERQLSGEPPTPWPMYASP